MAGTVGGVERLRPYPVAGLVAWTLFVWLSRVGLAWSDDSMSSGEKVLQTLPPVLFSVSALATGAVLLGRGLDRRPELLGRVTTAFAGFTIFYWAIRIPLILANDHEVGFKVVHAVLAIVSVALAVLAWRAVGRDQPAGRRQLSSSSAS